LLLLHHIFQNTSLPVDETVLLSINYSW